MHSRTRLDLNAYPLKAQKKPVRALFCFIFFLILGWNSALFAQTTINVLISPPRGGFGDTAANLLMIERLSAYYQNRNTVINVVYPKASVEQIHALWPSFDPHKNVQIVRGLVFTNEEKAQQADFVVTFSSNSDPNRKLGKTSILYYEYEEMHTQLSSEAWMVPKRDYTSGSIFTMFNNVEKYYAMNTGVGNGIYVLDGYRPEDFDKAQTFSRLHDFAPDIPFSDNARLGYAYASSPALVQQYIEAIEKWTSRHGTEVVVVTNHPVTTKNPLVKIVSMKGLPFNLNERIIKSSDIPILVTGDGSLSLAIEGRKPFFYSMYAWKRFTPDALRESIKKLSPDLRKDRQKLDLVSELLQLDITGNKNYTDQFLAVMEDLPLQTKLAQTFDKLVKTDSLVMHLDQDIQFIQSLKESNYLKPMFATPLKQLWQQVRKAGGLNAGIAKVETDLFDSRINSQRRLAPFVALKMVRTYSDQRFADLFSKALINGDFELKSALHGFIHDLHFALDLPVLYPLLKPAAQKELNRSLQYLASQDPIQWGSNADSAKESLKVIKGLSCQQLLQ